MSIDNKKINIVSDVNFDSNNITDAKINAQENTISNLEVSNFKSGVIQTTVRDTTNALDTVIPTEKAVSEALSNIQVNVIELEEGTNIDNLRQEGTFFIKNPTGTLPSITTFELDPEYDTYWCILTQEKCFDNTRGTYWYVQTGKFSYLSSTGITRIEAWQTYVRQINDYTYTDKKWQRLDNLTERIFNQSPASEAADMSINLNTFSDAESNSVINVGYINALDWRRIKSLELVSSLNGSCKIFFKTYTGVPPYGTDAFSVILSSYTSAQILNLDILTNYNFKFNTVYELNFQQISSGSTRFSIEITEIDKPFVQEYFPTQTGNSGKFLTTDGTTMSWATVSGGAFPTIVTDSGSSLPSASSMEWKDTFLNTSDKKIYKTLADTYEWNTNVTYGAVTIDYTTGIVTNISQGYANPRILHRQIGNTLWNGNKTYQVTFKMTSISQTDIGGNGLITFNSSKNTSTTHKRSFGVTKDKKIFYTEGYISSGSYHKEKEENFFEISENKKYTLVIEKTSSSCNVSLLENETQVATTSFTINDFSSVATSAYIEYGIAYIIDQYGRGLYTSGDIYLLESSGEFLVPSSDLSWDSGVAIEDKSEIADKTNGILYLYENDELVKIGGSLTKKVYTISADNTSTLNVSSDFTKVVDVLKNGVELALTDDYTISSGVITFVTALSTTDKITVKGE